MSHTEMAAAPTPEAHALDFRLATRAHVPLEVLADTIQPFPTSSEISVAALKALRAHIAAPQAGRRGTADGELTEGETMTTETFAPLTERASRSCAGKPSS